MASRGWAWLLVVAALSSAGLALPEAGSVGSGPSQVHIAELDDRISITWAVGGPAGDSGPGFVEWGLTPNLPFRTSGYLVEEISAAPFVGYSVADIERDMEEAPVTIYRADLPTVPPDRRVHYRVVDGDGHATATRSFRSLPDVTGELRLLHLADIGTHEDGTVLAPGTRSAEVAAAAAAQEAHVAVSAGDLAYAGEARQRFWNQWFDLMEPLTSTHSFFAAPGNHDTDMVIGYQQWNARFDFPGDEHNYAVDAGPASIIFVNSDEMCVEGRALRQVQRVNPDCRAGITNPETLGHLESLLADAAEADRPWTIVVFHHPPYSHGSYAEDEYGPHYQYWMRDTWLPLMEQYGVDLVLTAHDHNYQRSYPLLAGQIQDAGPGPYAEGAPVYVVSGGGGRTNYPLSSAPAPAWLASSAVTHQYLLVEADADELSLQSIQVPGGAILDSFTIVKP